MSVIKFDRDFSTLFNWDTDENPTTEQDYQNAVKNWTETEMNIVDTLLWQPTTEYATGNIVKTPSLPSQYVLRCTEAGTSGSTEPSYSGASVGDSVTDGTVEWVIVSLATGNAADVDASNIGVNAEVDNSEAWASAIGGGAIAEDDGRLVTGDTVYAVTSELASDIATNTEAIGDNTEAIATNTANIEASAVKIDIDDKRISNIEKLLQGNLYDYQTDTDSAYTKTVPQGAMPYASLDSVGGKTLVWNQDFPITTNNWNVNRCFVSLVDDVYEFTCTANTHNFFGGYRASSLVTNGHKYLYMCEFKVEATNTPSTFEMFYGVGNVSVSALNTWLPYQKIYTATASYGTAINLALRYSVVADVTVGDKVSVRNAMKIDLTLWFGAGNEPATVEEFLSMYPSYIPYNAGTLLSAGVTEVVSQGRNLYDNANAVIRYGFLSSSELPTGQTRFASSSSACCLALEVKPNTQYTLAKKVSVGGRVIFGVFDHIPADQEIGSSQQVTYQTVGEYTYYTFTTPQTAKYLLWYYFNRNDGGSTEAQIRETAMLTYGNTVYPYTPYTETSYPIPAEIRSLEGYGWSAGTVYNYIDYEAKKFIQNVGSRAYASGDESDSTVITDMTTTYYSLNPAVETDISAYITDDNLIEVEAGGTLTFPNSNGTDYQIPVPSSETYMVDLQASL